MFGSLPNAQLQAIFDELLSRDLIVFQESQALFTFLLEAIRSASLVHFERASGRRAIANIGAGRCLDVTVEHFPGEAPAALRYEGAEHYFRRPYVADAGDYRITIDETFDQNLEGTVLRSVGRRRKEEADSD